MICTKCGSFMHDFDGLNHECLDKACGHVFYFKNPDRERYLVERGWKRCPVCGRVAVNHNGNGNTCLFCSYKFSENGQNNKFDIYKSDDDKVLGFPISIEISCMIFFVFGVVKLIKLILIGG